MSIMLAALRSPRCIWPPHAASTVWSNCCWHAASIATCAPKMAIPPPRSHANAATSAPRRCSNLPNTKRATVLDPAARDEVFMRHALLLANRARHAGEVPVGALVVRGDRIVGEGWNQPIGMRDPSAHAEMLAMRAAAQTLGNYRQIGRASGRERVCQYG